MRKVIPATDLASAQISIGLFIVYAFGMVYYYVISNFVLNTPIGLWPLFLYCFLLAVPGISRCAFWLRRSENG